MNTGKWESEAGYTLKLNISPHNNSVTLYKGEEVVFRRLYEWFEYWRAKKEAEALAAFGHMQEVPSGLLLREGGRGQGEAGLVQ